MTHLTVPYFEQENDYYCGPGVMQMELGYYDLPVTQTWLAEKLYTSEEYGTFRKHMLHVGTEFGLHTFARSRSSVDMILQFLRCSMPVIVNYREPVDNLGHYAVIYGNDDTSLFFHDPYHGPDMCMPIDEFMQRWRGEFERSFRWLMVLSK